MSEKSKAIIVENFDLDKVLREVGQGYRAQIKRKEPTWCDGLIDTIDLDADDPISMEFLRQEYGGRKIQIVIQDADGNYVTARTVKFPDPPRKEGRDLQRFPDEQKQTAQQTASPFGEMKSIIDLMLTSQEKQVAALTKSLESRLSAIETTRGNGTGPGQKKPVDQLKESISAIKQINELKDEMGLSPDPAATPGEQENTITRAIDKFTDLMIEKEQAKIKAQIESAGGQEKAPPLPAASTYTPPQETPQAPAQAPAQAPVQNTAAAISNLSDLEFAAHVKNRLDALPEEEREEILAGFIDLYHPDPEDDEIEENNNSDEDENDLPSISSVKVIDEDGERESEPRPA